MERYTQTRVHISLEQHWQLYCNCTVQGIYVVCLVHVLFELTDIIARRSNSIKCMDFIILIMIYLSLIPTDDHFFFFFFYSVVLALGSKSKSHRLLSSFACHVAVCLSGAFTNRRSILY